MKPEDVQAFELVFEGWIYGVLSCLLYVSIKEYIEVKRENRRNK